MHLNTGGTAGRQMALEMIDYLPMLGQPLAPQRDHIDKNVETSGCVIDSGLRHCSSRPTSPYYRHSGTKMGTPRLNMPIHYTIVIRSNYYIYMKKPACVRHLIAVCVFLYQALLLFYMMLANASMLPALGSIHFLRSA